MADIATIGILQERSIRDAHAFSTQLEVALESRVVIEQAKGIVAERSHISVDEAFEQIRSFARAHNRLLSETRAPDHRRNAAGRGAHRSLVDTTSHPQAENTATTISSRGRETG